MRISDWSSDVCSSDLKVQLPAEVRFGRKIESSGDAIEEDHIAMPAMHMLGHVLQLPAIGVGGVVPSGPPLEQERNEARVAAGQIIDRIRPVAEDDGVRRKLPDRGDGGRIAPRHPGIAPAMPVFPGQVNERKSVVYGKSGAVRV